MFVFHFNAYVAIIGDIVGSKKIRNRNKTQQELKQVLENINLKYEEDIASNFMITLGDEFQGLLKYGRNTVDIMIKIESALWPVRLRFGLGAGEICTDIDPAFPLGADGPAYHNARTAIEQLKANDKKYATYRSNIKIISEGDNQQVDALLNSIFSLSTALKAKWTTRQKEIIACFLDQNKNQRKTAEKLGIQQSSINRALDNSAFYSYHKAMDTASTLLGEVKGAGHV